MQEHDEPLSKWFLPICLIKGHDVYNVNPHDYRDVYENKMPIGGCKRCGKVWWKK